MLIPTKIIEVLSDYIKSDPDFSSINEKQRHKLIKVLVELWYFIYSEQIKDIEVSNLKMFVDIKKDELERFNVRLGKDIIGNEVRLKYAKLLEILILCNLIERGNSYSAGKFPKGHRIISDFIGNDYTQFEIDFDYIFKNVKNKSYWLDRMGTQSSLVEDCYNTEIDLSGYLNYLLENEGMELKPVLINGRLNKRYLTRERIWHHFNLSLKVNLKNLWFKMSNEGRFYSSISNLPYTAVAFIKLYGEETREVDIKNSQPLLLATIINNDDYKRDVCSGQFYDKMANELNIKRDEFKVMSYKFIFFGSNQLSSGKLYSAMEKVYPGLIGQINDVKKDLCLAKYLQELESNIFVKKIGALNIPKLLRHDQVIVKKNDLNIVLRYLKIEYSKLGLKDVIINY